MNPYVLLAAAFVATLFLLGAGFFAGIIWERAEAKTLNGAGVVASRINPMSPRLQILPGCPPGLTNRHRVSILTGIPEEELNSANRSPDDTVFWYGLEEFTVTLTHILNRKKAF
jgi:hypothetical protein